MNSSSTDSRRNDDLPPFSPFNTDAPPNPPSIRSLSSASTSRSHRTSLAPSSINDELKLFINKASKLAVQLDNEKRRADDAERRLNEVLIRFKAVNDARVAAIQEATRANSELELYKLQLDTAQREIIRAQDVAVALESQRFQAERDAAEARSRLRRLNEKALIDTAHEEGRRRGLREGLQRGRELGFPDGVSTEYQESRLYEADTLADDSSLLESIQRYPTTAPTSRRQSVADSRRQSRTPTDTRSQIVTSPPRSPIPDRGNAAPVLPTSPPPVPIPPPDMPQAAILRHEYTPSVANTVHAMTPRPMHANIPPDNYIPNVGPDNIIRIPPPHEFHPPIVTTEQPPPSQVPVGAEAPYAATSQHVYRAPHYSPASNSTTLSQLDILDNPPNINLRSPMSVIPEVPSPSVRNLSRAGSIQQQPSVSGSSVRRASVAPGATTPALYTRPISPSSSVSSLHPVRKAGSNTGRGQRSSTSTSVPDINIQPPSRPASSSTQQTSGNVNNHVQHSTFNEPSPASFANSEQPINATPLTRTDNGMPGGMPDSYIMRESFISTGEGHGPPVIPDAELMRSHASDSDVASSQDSGKRPEEPYIGNIWLLNNKPRELYGQPSSLLRNAVAELESSSSGTGASEGRADSLRTTPSIRSERARWKREAEEHAREQLAMHVHGTPRSTASGRIS